jgi:hypothetical protein
VTSFFFWVWVVYSAGCALTFVWGLFRTWELEILMPPAFFVIGSVVWWVVYLVLDKIGQHVTIHIH